MANSQWLQSGGLIFHLQVNAKMKINLEWCRFKKSIVVQQVLQIRTILVFTTGMSFLSE